MTPKTPNAHAARQEIAALAAHDLKTAIGRAKAGYAAARKASEQAPCSSSLIREVGAWRALRDALLETATAADLA